MPAKKNDNIEIHKSNNDDNNYHKTIAKKKVTKKLVNDIKKSAKIPITKDIIKFLPTASVIMDCIGGGGHPSGGMINIVGDKSSGKTIFTVEALYRIKDEYGDKVNIYYDDTEAGFTFNCEEIYKKKAFDIAENPSDTVEDFQMNLDDQLDKIKDDEYLVYVVDSLDGLTSEAELKKIKEEIADKKAGRKGKGDYGAQKAKKMSQIFRTVKKKIRRRNCLLIIISQVRENLNASSFSPKLYRAGGKAMDFYALQVFWLAHRSDILKKKTSIGALTKVINTKNKVGKPLRSGYISLLYDYGIDHVISNIRYLFDLYTEKGEVRNSKIKWDDEELMSPRALVQYIEENDLEKELEKRVIKKWNDFEDSIAVKGRKQKY